MAFGDTLSLACKDGDDLPFGVSLISALGHLQSLVTTASELFDLVYCAVTSPAIIVGIRFKAGVPACDLHALQQSFLIRNRQPR